MKWWLNDIAVVACSCDQYSWLWDEWYYYFNKNWNINCNVYFLTEKGNPNFDEIINIKVNIPGIHLWTKRLRESLKQIPENNIFFFMGDEFLNKQFEENEFERIYNAFKIINADALRIKDIARFYTIHDTEFYVNNVNLKKFDPFSEYLISYSPNIWKKSFLLECIKHDESPWDSEMIRGAKMRGGDYGIYIYEKLGLFVNVLKRGKVTTEGQKLLK